MMRIWLALGVVLFMLSSSGQARAAGFEDYRSSWRHFHHSPGRHVDADRLQKF
jgi:hypothetical protein